MRERQSCDSLAGDTPGAWRPPWMGDSQTHSVGLSPCGSVLLCFSWAVPGLGSKHCCGRARNCPRGQGDGEHSGDPRLAEPAGRGTCGCSPTLPAMRVTLLPCLSSLGTWGVPQAPLQGVHMWALGKPTCTLLRDRSPPGLWGGCGDSLAAGMAREGLHPMLHPMACHQGGESLSATWHRGHPCTPASLPCGEAQDLGHFAGFCLFCWR